MSVADNLSIISANVPLVHEAGKAAERREFMEKYQNGGISRNQTQTFSGLGWTDETYNPLYPIIGSNFLRTFYQSQISDTKVDIDATGSSTGLNTTFGYSKIVRIHNLIISENTAYSSTFTNCTALEELNITGTIGQNGFNVQHSKKLSKQSFINIFNSLSATTSGLSITVSKNAVNNAFGINVDDESTYPDGSEYYKLRHSRDNWSINYV